MYTYIFNVLNNLSQTQFRKQNIKKYNHHQYQFKVFIFLEEKEYYIKMIIPTPDSCYGTNPLCFRLILKMKIKE